MGGGGGTIAGKTSKNNTQQPQQPQTPPTNFQDLRGVQAARMLGIMDDYNVSTRRAINQYIRQDQDRYGYTMSQNMNHKMENGQELTGNEQYTADYLVNAAKPIGQDVVLTRGAHQDVLQKLGINNYQNMTESQLRAALVGQTYTENKFVSTSVDA